MKLKKVLVKGRFSPFVVFISRGKGQYNDNNQSKGEKAGGHETILFSFTVKVHVKATCPTLHSNLIHDLKLLEEKPLV